ncbi:MULTISPECIES: nicotinate-nucleotide--dimethylbenzimidazole phosphoribosyltransferase [Sphaerochaeta]|jgi:nicotinate-nucleotide--dimethylbenzimidazole phosphoribosyltransferase|uniref:Nicotinate-nucleotide--dimethylbenzimidazole phosphoribosyltransferase n=1 Tax=Sphaerochaeta associata TaxID=1129264 RepID=A0ABY4DD09_9SPIR|nr:MULTISPECIES: nicotinate-nucleotide--dimethylbenzimidazole phosphoribosyltransferase [Sphaerochaeta]MDT3358369.1 nicotinate-nucleotide--dimethylbenzimidazole phosphoribosyltransferase [Spirochaetota bacterium]MDD3424017.1 nicotinate-nucleotide--dimethylbenzimidazole phosphoribosyltransferase [Sphaerochaeta sp.]MDD3456740.1 nicotinate-nucleotide--dimethylbenzimidazole phosphoribosyltransferase [Sphaerochaeta sp.]MDD4037955.1 nicotinate-nucleotide--dimethylbenzimidazole phosphoribosyltransfera
MSIPPIDRSSLVRYQQILLSKAMPPHSLGRLSDLALDLAMIRPRPLKHLSLLLFAADHGIVEEGVTHSPVEITYQQCLNFARGGGACSLFASQVDAALAVIDVAVKHTFSISDNVVDRKVAWGSRNFLTAPALEREACLKAVETGRQLVLQAHERGCDAIAFGEMGVGNTTSASSMAAALTGLPVPSLTGKGSGLSDAELLHKIAVIEQALVLHPQRAPFEVLCNLGGYELAAIVGGMWQAAELGLPILLDGYVVSSAALVAVKLEPALADYLITCHRSAMQGHQAILDAIGCKPPLLDLAMQLGEGTGALAAWPLVRLASRILFEMTSFEEGNVTNSTALLAQLGVV